ncbi:MAG: UDP-N-acetylglucosamine--N-acetylmuramyl-(pentapeptide) pyrophosphoryl-undecaprenol N-acetylglucosamine transferase [Betaproteobacteria bacterium]|nr:UDP-N-acetylglucosamine--N-acetylmuramyl-(pentapeptide) pyrophosphoryl-undecaprenol N-acetylglucosamine transferase [Betaproteobacteria bacterium]
MREPLTLGLTGGGTAGHVLPHFAIATNPDSTLAEKINAGEIRIVYFGGRNGMERDIVTHAQPNWTYVPIRTGKLRRYFSLQNFVDPINILLGFFTALIMMRRLRVGCLFSKGGFVSAPVVWAAWLNRIPVVIHESDATPALATRLTLPFAQRALVSFEETLKWIPQRYHARVRASGLPLRSELFTKSREAALAFFKLNPDLPTLLVFGGSLGAEGLNRRVAAVLPQLSSSWNIIHIVGKGKSFTGEFGSWYRQYEFLSSEMSLAYAAADLALCRAGASSIFELAAARIPMLLVPLGLHQSRGDQIINAKIFAAKGWATWCDEQDLSPDKIVSLLEQLRTQNVELKRQLERAPGAQTAARVAQLLMSLLQRNAIAEPF